MAAAALFPTVPLRMRLGAHDEDPPAATVPAAVFQSPPKTSLAPPEAPPAPESDPKATPEASKPLGPNGEKTLRDERDARKVAERRAVELEARVQAFEDAQKSELEKAQAAAERAQKAVEAANRRAVTAEIKAAAADRFDDADLVLALVGQDPATYVTAAGDVDTDAIGRALTDLADRKPKLLKQAAAPVPVQEAPKIPKVPDPGQGPRGASPEVDLMKATEEEFRTALAKFTTIRPH